MADFSKLGKLNSGSYKFKNPYTHKEEPKQVKTPSTPEPKTKGVLELYGYETGKMRMLQDEVNNLKLDILTLLDVMEGNFPHMSIAAMRERYTDFRTQKEHAANRITKKIEAINNGDYHV
jgi:hypothetical protein